MSESISLEEAEYRLVTARAIGELGNGLAKLQGEVYSLRLTLSGFGTVTVILLGSLLSYLIMHG